MEQLSAVVYVDEKNVICAGYKDVTYDEFWVRGHMPGLPLMPGVVMLESIAQLCSFVTQRYDLLGAQMVGFGGLEDVRFRDIVLPGDRLIVMCKLDKVRRGRMIVCQFQGVVKDRIVVEGLLKGIPIPVDAVRQMLADRQP
jgi:3-hydroxyacyl-[acyl-carrier-protein] dehydratase